MRRRIAGIVTALVFILLPASVMGHSHFSSSNYRGADDVVDSGGGRSSSADYRQLSAIGQSGQGTLSSGHYYLHAGFLHPIPPSPTPTVTPTHTASETPVMTATPSATVTATASATATLFSTVPPENTATVTPTFTNTATETASLTATETSTATVSPTQTASLTATVTSTATSTPTSHLAGLDLTGCAILAFPNPAKDRMTFVFHLEQAARVELHIYNMAGEQVAALSGDFPGSRGRSLAWDCRSMAPGIYLARMQVNGEETAKIKVALIRP